MALSDVKALAFDVFGTVVDYRGTIIREGERLNRAKGVQVDWAACADAWRARYRPSMDRVMQGTQPWTTLDTPNPVAQLSGPHGAALVFSKRAIAIWPSDYTSRLVDSRGQRNRSG